MKNLSRETTLKLYNIEDLKDMVRFDAIAFQLEQADEAHNRALLKRLPELAEHPNPDMEYENYRDNVDDDFRGAAEAQGMPEDKIDEALENLSEGEKADYAHDWDIANNMWK